MSSKTTIKCPNCHTEIDVNEILYHQLEDEFKEKSFIEKKKLDKAFDELKVQKDSFNEELEKATAQQIKLEKQKLHVNLKKQLEEEQAESVALLKKELDEKSNQVKELNRSKAEVEKLKREKDEIESKVKADAQLALSKQLKVEKEKILKLADETNELKFKQQSEQMEQLKRQLQDAQRKAEQGSMQIQGEAQELAIEEWLASQFVFDSIEEVKKGAHGADCVQVVHTREVQNCGRICYESKNAKSWSSEWVVKLKHDMLKVGADIGVLVTQVMPKEMDRMGFVDGIWVCSLEEFKGSSTLLRESLIRVHKSIAKEENKSDKMSLLYNYLSSNEFSMQLGTIVDGFMAMQTELDKEKRSLMASWKRRQKLIDGVLANTTEMYGSLQGIAGSAIGHIEALELPYGDVEADDDV
ncbi:MAG: DUF2130 domain-containing protein [Campylobacterota bacterium]|nr:DUF2130 domain-containing protein [Campylobacterota bacterium]